MSFASPPATAGPVQRPHLAIRCDGKSSCCSFVRIRCNYFLAKRLTGHDPKHQIMGLVIVLAKPLSDQFYCTEVFWAKASAQRVAQHLSCQVAGEDIFLLHQVFLQAGRAINRSPVGQNGGCIDRATFVLVPPTPKLGSPPFLRRSSVFGLRFITD